MRLIFDLNIDRCSACSACAVACMDQNDIDIEHGAAPFRVTSPVEDGSGQEYLSAACMHCDNAPCVLACPTGCITKDGETGLTVYDNTGCIGCHSCAMACPFAAPTFGADGKMCKCDGCITRLRCGLEPACVRTCPTGALKCVGEQEAAGEHISRSLRRIAKGILETR